ncbi:hypothetical protein HK098_003316 [Nowakowskiella sp. JEL0407]|nr:hypothetical protein HK098_003316 [Nowakowskiella sp. JEL0407]
MGTDTTKSTPEETRGIIPRATEQIFLALKDKLKKSYEQSLKRSLKVSFLEIYQESLRDLLAPEKESREISIREDKNGTVLVNGALEVDILSEEDLLRCLEKGVIERTTGDNKLHSYSSRSHAIFSISFEETFTENSLFTGTNFENASPAKIIKSAKLHLVDLAGSERLKRTGAEGVRLKEAVKLFCVIFNAISELITENDALTAHLRLLSDEYQHPLTHSSEHPIAVAAEPNSHNHLNSQQQTLSFSNEDSDSDSDYQQYYHPNFEINVRFRKAGEQDARDSFIEMLLPHWRNSNETEDNFDAKSANAGVGVAKIEEIASDDENNNIPESVDVDVFETINSSMVYPVTLTNHYTKDLNNNEENDSIKISYDELVIEIRQIQKQKVDLLKDVARSAKEMERLKQQNADKLSKMEKDNETLRRDVMKLREAIGEKELIKEKLKDDYDKKIKNFESQNAKLKSKTKEYERVSKERDQFERRAAELETELDKINGIHSGMKRKLKEDSDKLNDLKRQCADDAKKIRALEDAVENLEAKLHSKTEKLNALQVKNTMHTAGNLGNLSSPKEPRHRLNPLSDEDLKQLSILEKSLADVPEATKFISNVKNSSYEDLSTSLSLLKTLELVMDNTKNVKAKLHRVAKAYEKKISKMQAQQQNGVEKSVQTERC